MVVFLKRLRSSVLKEKCFITDCLLIVHIYSYALTIEKNTKHSFLVKRYSANCRYSTLCQLGNDCVIFAFAVKNVNKLSKKLGKILKQPMRKI